MGVLDFEKPIEELESKINELKDFGFEAIKQLLEPLAKSKRQIGFHP